MDKTVTQWKFDSRRYPIILSKKPSKITIGFEWEVPLNYYQLDLDSDGERWDEEEGFYTSIHDMCADDILSKKAYADIHRTLSFNGHIECGGLEVCSPVSTNISTARALAKRLKAAVRKELCFDEDINNDQGGIHVHTGHTSWSNGREVDTDFSKVQGMLNRDTSSSFVEAFSGRDSSHEYYFQCLSTGWDRYSTTPSASSIDAMQMSNLVRLNEFSGENTIEYRIWNGVEDRLMHSGVMNYLKVQLTA